MFLLKEVDLLYDRFSERVYAAGKLDKKTKELIALACSVMADCAPCIEWHHRQAAQAGAAAEEVSEAVAIAMSVCSGSKRAKYGPLMERLESERK